MTWPLGSWRALSEQARVAVGPGQGRGSESTQIGMTEEGRPRCDSDLNADRVSRSRQSDWDSEAAEPVDDLDRCGATPWHRWHSDSESIGLEKLDRDQHDDHDSVTARSRRRSS
eukprot:2523879-Rhodomonas_salina.1